MYRVWCEFHPGKPRLNGGAARGVWTVYHQARTPAALLPRVITAANLIGVLSDTQRTPGYRVSPFKLLKEAQRARIGC